MHRLQHLLFHYFLKKMKMNKPYNYSINDIHWLPITDYIQMKRKISTIRDVPSAKRRVNQSIESGFNLNTSNSRQSCNEYGYLLIASIIDLPCEIYLHIEHYVSGVPLSDEEIRKAVKLYFDNKEECERIYGKMKYWNTRKTESNGYVELVWLYEELQRKH